MMPFIDIVEKIVRENQPITPQDIRDIIIKESPDHHGTPSHLRSVKAGYYRDIDNALLSQVYTTKNNSRFIADTTEKPMLISISGILKPSRIREKVSGTKSNKTKSQKPIINLKNIEFTLSEDDIRKYIKLYMEGGEIKNNDGRTLTARYSSFDYCFNYFQQFKRNKNIKDIAKNSNLEKSCLHLGFYLASWGMFRGNAKLLQKSLPYLKNQLEVISEFDENIWEIDVDNYNHENIELLSSFKKELIKSFDYKPTDTLITKIMLGVFGNVMAYDTYVEKTYKSMQMGSFSKPCLLRLNYFYTNFKTTIDREVNKLKTLTFPNNDKLKNQYTVAKVLDMIGFIKGRIDNEKKST